MSLNDVCQELVETVDGAKAVGVVDLHSGMIMGVHHNVPYFTQSYLDAVGAAAVEMLRGRTTSTVEELLSNIRGKKVENTMQEVQMTTPGTYHFISVLPNKPNAAVIMVTDKKTNLGMGWARLRAALPKLEPMCP